MRLTKKEDEFLYKLVEKLTGTCQEGRFRKDLIATSVLRRIQENNLSSLGQYLDYITHNTQEYYEFLSAITIHTTNWFRERPHFKHLKKYILENKSLYKNKMFRGLILACSTGEEPYGLGIVLESLRAIVPHFNYHITAIDIDPVSVHHAKRALYLKSKMHQIPSEYHSLLFAGKGEFKNYFTLDKEIRKRCTFKVGNILEAHLMESDHFDAIFCRNCLIYFDQKSVEKFIKNISHRLEREGILTLGHSEAIIHPERFRLHPIWSSSYTLKMPKLSIESKKTILVVDDSPTIRKILSQLLSKNGYNVVEAENAEMATKKLENNKVDLVTLDLHMPGEDGSDWLVRKRKEGVKIPVVIITDVNVKEAISVLNILDNGAQEYINKSELTKDADQILEKIKVLLESYKIQGQVRTKKTYVAKKKMPLKRPELILIGASTGGTEALTTLLKNFPKDCPPILVVQHISENFSLAFAERLALHSGLLLGEFIDGLTLKKGHIYLSTGDFHIGVKKSGTMYKLVKSSAPPKGTHRPSVDFLFSSAQYIATKVMAILLTGMGRDGADALLTLHEKNATTIVQDELSCVVFGMPKVAIELGAFHFVGNLGDIRKKMEKAMQSK